MAKSKKRRWRLIKAALWTIPVLGLLAMVALWCWPRAIASRGGLYWPWRMELRVPSFAQGDPRWKDDLLGSTPDSLHAKGCAVTSAAMVLASYGIDIDPGRLNGFLTQHGGYTPEGWIYWEKAAEYQPGRCQKAYEEKPSFARIDWNLLWGNPVIVRIQLPRTTHFVVIAGKSGREYLIRDPGAGARRGMYPLSQIAPRIEALRYYRRL